MSRDKHLRNRFGYAALLAAFLLLLGAAFADAQTSTTPLDPAPDTQKEVSVAPDARDAEIAARLRRIVDASGWFSSITVSVREGIVFLDGQTETDEYKDWAGQLALRTEDVVAVVNRIDVRPSIQWDLAPTWRELGRLADRAQWVAPLIAVSLVILLTAWLLSRGVAALARHLLRGRIQSPLLLNFAARTVSIPVILIGVYLVLQVAGLTRLAITVLGGTGLIGIVLGLAFREIAENSLASILLSVRNPFRTDDLIQVGEYQGIVQSLNMRTTVLLTLDGNHVQIPNSLVFKSIITNFSTNSGRRAEFTVGIGFDDSIVMAQEIIIHALRAHPAVLDDPEPGALVDELGSSTVNIKVQFWFDGRSYSIFKVRSSLMRQVKRALEDAGISMPDEAREIIFPQGVPIRREPSADTAGKRGVLRDATTGDGEAATVSVGEGDLVSEEGELRRQAASADLPEAADNLLLGGRKKVGPR